MKLDNNWYGHRYIFSKYCNCEDKNAFATIQHGYASDETIEKEFFSPNFKFAKYLCWTPNIKKIFEKKNFYNVITIGAPFIYLCEMLKKKKINKLNKIIFFPNHTVSGNCKGKSKYSSYNEKIVKKIKKLAPVNAITVCLYYKDYTEKNINFYAKKGFRVIKGAERQNVKSLYKIYNEIRGHSIVVTTNVSSSLFYGMYLKKKTKVLMLNYKKKYHFFYLSKIDKNLLNFFYKKYNKLFKSYLTASESYKLGSTYLGKKYLKTRKELKKILGWDNFFLIFLAKLLRIIIFSKEKKNLT